MRPGADPAGHQSGEMVGIYARNMPGGPRPTRPCRPRRQRAISPHQHPSISCATSSGCRHQDAVRGEQPSSIRRCSSSTAADPPYRRLDGTVDLRGCAAASHLQAFSSPATTNPARLGCGEREHHYRMDDLLTLIYTSGHHGRTRMGSCLDFANMAACFEMHDAASTWAGCSLCMLPLSHVFERAWATIAFHCGAENVTFATRRR